MTHMMDGLDANGHLGLERWRDVLGRVLADNDPSTLGELLHPDVEFRSPAVHKAYHGPEVVTGLLTAVSQVFEDFVYTSTVRDGDRAVLFFTARVGDRAVEGIDDVHFDAEGRVTRLTVMVRPLSGLTALATAMQAKLVEMGLIPA